jgi:hypothetical protein
MRISAFNRSCERKQSRIYPSRSLKKVTISFDHDPILFSTANPADEVFGRYNGCGAQRYCEKGDPAPITAPHVPSEPNIGSRRGAAMIRSYSDHAANERTFLAWLRTSIAVIAFGFVVEKLNLFALTAVSAPSLNEASRSQLEKLSGPLGRGAGHAFIVVRDPFHRSRYISLRAHWPAAGRLVYSLTWHSARSDLCRNHFVPAYCAKHLPPPGLKSGGVYLLNSGALLLAKAAGRHSRQALQRDGEQSPLARSHAALSDGASSRRKWALLRSRRLWKVT